MEKLLDVKEIAHVLGVGQSTIRFWVRGKKIPFLRVGRFIRFRPRDIERWAEFRGFRLHSVLTQNPTGPEHIGTILPRIFQGIKKAHETGN